VFAFLQQLQDRDGPITLRPWQRRFITGLYRRPRPRLAYLQVARQQGKSHVAALIGLYALVADNAKNPVVAILANSERQAGELFAKAHEVVRHTPDLEACLGEYANRLVYDAAGTRLQVFASSPAGAMGGGGRQVRGISAHLVIADELAFTPDPSLWESTLWPTILSDPEGCMLALTTPGFDMNGPAYGLYRRAKAGDRDRFYAQIHEPADPDCKLTDRRAWRQANPSMGHGLAVDDLRVALANASSEESFRREHLGQWTKGESQWIHRAQWDALKTTREVLPGERITAAFDGSWSRDSTAIVGCTEDAHLFVIGLWEKPPGPAQFRIPRQEVEDRVAEMFATYDVVDFACDPSYWERELAEWGTRYGEHRVLEFPPTRQRMAPACVAFAGAVHEARLSHDGDERLARHVCNAITRASPFGDFITKVDKDSPSKIDAAIAAVIAHHRSVLRRESRKLAQVW
jgi:phage terminase large subunit-like protein